MASEMKIAEEPEEPLDDFVIDDAYVSWQRRDLVRIIQDFAFGGLQTIGVDEDEMREAGLVRRGHLGRDPATEAGTK